ncbi:endonuclease III [Helicobacter aurati]|uniref:Endonuclease III n=1 Tax=Helicobacter aurati TaxID=137778 RepID=A0A3D8J5Q7_9HELI|nr:endonuclease III [Helicobacter aurati]RDU72516.1 endonuclease III [Helicobacter aurati]
MTTFKNQIFNGYDLLTVLKRHYKIGDSHSWWWPSFRSVKIDRGMEICGALDSEIPDISMCFAGILGQNTKYENAWSALVALYEYLFIQMDCIFQFDSCYIESFKHYEYPNLAFISQTQWQDSLLAILYKTSHDTIAKLIRKAGFHNQKARYIALITKNIVQDFGSFDNFAKKVNKEWLLLQKGIGNESASSILNYALKREEMVVDRYTQKLLISLGYEHKSYEDMQDFLLTNLTAAITLYDFDISLAQVMARLHGKIVEHCKRTKIGKNKEKEELIIY